MFKSGYAIFLSTKKAISKFTKAEEFIKQIIQNTKHLKINISDQNFLSKISNYSKYLNFLETVSDQSTHSSSLILGFMDTIEYLNSSLKWYNFLLKLHERLSEYEIQKDANKYNITNLTDQITKNGHSEVKITEIDLEQFLCEISMKEHYIYIKDITIINQLKLNVLSNILNLTLKNKMQFLCENNTLVVTGRYVKLTDVVILVCPDDIPFINIFALNKIFINTNLDKTGDKVKLSIIAPTWEIIGSQKIILDGKPGAAHNVLIAEAGINPGNNGTDGKPGLPVVLLVFFLGIGKTFINGKNLQISANGGKGGSGQHGGNGRNGIDGETPTLPYPKFNYYDQYVFQKFYYVRSIDFFTGLYNELSFKLFGEEGKRGDGSNGGEGGLGGMGGNKGNIKLIELNNSSEILTESSQGGGGTVGNGGNAGNTKDGDTLYIETRFATFFVTEMLTQTKKQAKHISCNKRIRQRCKNRCWFICY